LPEEPVATSPAEVSPPPVDDVPPCPDEPLPAPVDPPDEPPDAAGALVLLEPSTATELLFVVTGAEPGAVTWLPPPVDDEPFVVEPDDPPEVVDGAVDDPVLVERPNTATEFPLAATGAATEVLAWLPPRVLFAPVVPDCAEACPAMNRIPPPTNRAVSRPRRTYACMVVPS
jgi:hypothetical protein